MGGKRTACRASASSFSASMAPAVSAWMARRPVRLSSVSSCAVSQSKSVRTASGIGALGAAGDVIAFRKKREARDLGEGRTQEVENLERTGAAVAVEAIIIADQVNGIIYTTRDGGQTFEAEKTAMQAHGAGLSTRRVLRISETER